MNLTRADLVFAKKLLRLDLTDHWQRLNLKYIKQLEDEYIRWSSSDDTGIKSPEISLLRFMLFQVEEQKDGVSRLKKMQMIKPYVKIKKPLVAGLVETRLLRDTSRSYLKNNAVWLFILGVWVVYASIFCLSRTICPGSGSAFA